ncbi:hypothetical protein D3C86_1457300 [compost metagenome]
MSVYNTKVYTLGFVTLFLSHIGNIDTIYFSRCSCVNIGTTAECLTHIRITADRRYNAQFDLGIIGTQQDMLFISGDKCFPDLAPAIGTHRYVLQVGIITAQASGYGCGLAVRGMYSTCFGIDHQWQGIYISIAQFGQFPETENIIYDLMFIRQLQ